MMRAYSVLFLLECVFEIFIWLSVLVLLGGMVSCGFRLRSIVLRNFLSFKDAVLDLGRLNIVVGPNASGKSNLINLFRFLRLCFGVSEEPRLPYLPWWSSRNLVWGFDESLPVKVGFVIKDSAGRSIYYGLVFSMAGDVSLEEEELVIGDFTRVVRRGRVVEVSNSEGIVEKLAGDKLSFRSAVESCFREEGSRFVVFMGTEVRAEVFERFVDEVLGKLGYSRFVLKKGFSELSLVLLNEIKDMCLLARTSYGEVVGKMFIDEKGFGVSGALVVPSREYLLSLCSYLLRLFKPFVIGPINFSVVKEPVYARREDFLEYDCRNLVNVLYNMYLSDREKWEELVYLLKTYFFPDIDLSFRLTETGKVMLVVREKGLEHPIPPTNLPSGLYKVLALLLAVLLEPPIIAVDELENSLHPGFIDSVLSLLRDCESTCIVTTHSPAVLDLVDLSEVVVVEKGPEGSKFSRIRDVDEVKKWLQKVKASVSDYVFYR
ncbi:MAG: hypothetical protein DRJ52_09900 [Thermoprotei archaeon]|nr:MAG: hypothetical protein DRJ52_09900 [Thermoprotei archaeon]